MIIIPVRMWTGILNMWTGILAVVEIQVFWLTSNIHISSVFNSKWIIGKGTDLSKAKWGSKHLREYYLCKALKQPPNSCVRTLLLGGEGAAYYSCSLTRSVGCLDVCLFTYTANQQVASVKERSQSATRLHWWKLQVVASTSAAWSSCTSTMQWHLTPRDQIELLISASFWSCQLKQILSASVTNSRL